MRITWSRWAQRVTSITLLMSSAQRYWPHALFTATTLKYSSKRSCSLGWTCAWTEWKYQIGRNFPNVLQVCGFNALCSDVLFRPALDQTGLSVAVFDGNASICIRAVFHMCSVAAQGCVYDARLKWSWMRRCCLWSSSASLPALHWGCCGCDRDTVMVKQQCGKS